MDDAQTSTDRAQSRTEAAPGGEARESGGGDDPVDRRGSVAGPSAERRAARIAIACKIYKARLDRARFFRSALFGEAGWDTLLAIYVFGAAGRTLSAGELCNATTETSVTSALRLQRRLADLGFLQRVGDPGDLRRVLVELTPYGMRVLEDYLDYLIDQQLAPASEDAPPEHALVEFIRERLTGIE